MTNENDACPKCLHELSAEFGYRLIDRGNHFLFDDSRIRSPITVNFEFTNCRRNALFVYCYVRSTSWDFIGERTDVNELMSVMLAVFLRLECGISCSLWDIPHPISGMPQTEIYARYLVANQPFGSEYSLDENGLKGIRNILRSVRAFECNMPHLLDWTAATPTEESSTLPQDYGWVEIEEWARNIASVIDEPWKCEGNFGPDTIQFNWRVNPNWNYYRSIESGVTVYEIPGLASALVARISATPLPWQLLDGPKSRIFVTDQTFNAIAVADSELAKRLLGCLSNEIHLEDIVLVPMEHDIVAASHQHIAFFRRDSGRKRFEHERELIRARHQIEASILFPPVGFIWNKQVDDQQFEHLILELLRREPGVQRVRLVGGTRERDSGRDIICDWHTPPTPSDLLADDVPPSALRKVIVQCKAYQRAVNKSHVQDIRDTVEHSDADGYFLAVSSHISSPLTDHLDRIRQQGQIWIDWWTRTEIEERLTKNSDIAKKYPGVVQPKCT